MKRQVTIFMRDGGEFITEIDSSANDPINLGRRMTGGGFVVAGDSKWGKPRTLVINANDVSVIEIGEEVRDGQ